jgi:hypothetical protein
MRLVSFWSFTLDHYGLTSLLEMKQKSLIKRVIEALGLDDGYAKGKHTPAESKPFVKDVNGEAAHCGFSYSSIIGMLFYLSGHTRPDIVSMLSIVVLGICSFQSTYMSWL